jgi:hypothetical protein
MPQKFDILLNSGMDQGADRVFLDGNVLAYAQNVRLARDGRLEVRPGFSALNATTMSSGTLDAYDLFNYQGRLVALGSQLGNSRADDLFEWNARISKWRGTNGDASTTSGTAARLPRLTDVRKLAGVPEQERAVRNVRLAAGAGFICAVINLTNGVLVHVFDPATDQTILFEPVSLSYADVTYAGSDFWIVGSDSNSDAAFTNFDPTTDEGLPAPTVDTTLTTINDVWATTFGSGWAYGTAGTDGVLVKTKTGAGVAVASITVSATVCNAVALVGNTAGTILTVFKRETATGDVTAESFDAAGLSTAGPNTIQAATTERHLDAHIRGSSSTCDVVTTVGSDSKFATVSMAAASVTTSATYYDATLTCAGVMIGSTPYSVFVDTEAAADDVGTAHIVDTDTKIPQAFLSPQLLDPDATGRVSKAAAFGTKLYVGITTTIIDTGLSGRRAVAQIYEAETVATGRRQMAQAGGELLIAGGLPLTYDGRVLCEQGFAERPVIVSGTQGTTGSLTALGVYNAIPVWEVFDSKGRLLRSQAGSPLEVTLTGANDDITWVVTTPHSLRRHPNYADQQITLRVSVYRTEAGEGVFFLDKQTLIDVTDSPAETVSLLSTQSDALLIDNLVLYEQSQTPLSHVAPPPYRYVWPTRERAFAAGQPDTEFWTQSKLFFPGEPVTWASPNQLGFSGRVAAPITAVASFDTAAVVWTEEEVWLVSGRGPEHDGSGDFDAATRIPSPGGCIDWRSVVVAPQGAFFQMLSDRLMLLGRDGQVSWAGSPVQDTLEDYPTIVGAVYVRALDQVVFACNNSAGDDGVFLVLDLSNGQWFVDTLSEAIRAVSELDGRLVYASATGTVKQQEPTIGQGDEALPTMRIETASFRLFGATGWGDVCKVELLATRVGDCTLEGFISYDDGLTWTSMGSYSITSTDASAGGSLTKEWVPNRRVVDRFRLRFDVSNASHTGGLQLHAISLEVDAQEGQARLPSRDKR